MGSKDRSQHPDDAPPTDRWQTSLFVAFVALVVARTFVPEDPGGKMGHGAPFDVLWLALAGAWLLSQWQRGQLQLRFGWPEALVTAFVAWHSVAAFVAIHSGSPRPAMNMLWDWVAMGLAFLLARQLLGTMRDARAAMAVMIGLASGMSAVALHQYFVAMPVDTAIYDAAKHSVAELYVQTGQWLPPDSNARSQFETRLASRLPTAGFALSNSLAGFLVPWLVMLVGCIFQFRRWTTAMVPVVVAALMAVCIWFTGSRTAGVAVVTGMSLLAFERLTVATSLRQWWQAIAAGVVAAAIFAAIVVASTPFGKRATDAAWRSVVFRIEYWLATSAMIVDYPLLGCGPGQFQDSYTGYKPLGAAEEIQDPHNCLLEVWSTAGTPAVILLLAALAAIVFRLVPADRVFKIEIGESEQSAPTHAALIGGVAGIAMGASLAWLTGFPLARIHIALYIAAMIGVYALLRSWTRNGELPRQLALIAAIALMVNLLAAGGIGYPSVADSLWLLLAIQLNAADTTSAAGRPNVNASKGIGWVLGVTIAALLVTAIRTEYRPVMSCRLHLNLANAAIAEGSGGAAREALEAAVMADPRSAEAATRLAAQKFADYEALPTAAQIRNFTEADSRVRQLAPHNAGTWAQSGDYAAAIYEDTRDVEYRRAAEEYYARAVELYPSSASIHGQFARFWDSVSEDERAEAAATEALRLDDVMLAAGHDDRVLDVLLRAELEAIVRTTH